MDITHFDDFLAAARQQSEPQRLLFTFAVAELPGDANAAQKAAFERGEGGALVPAVCVDKALDELSTFAAFAQEAEQFSLDWVIVFAASLSGRNGTPPSAADAEEPIKRMVAMIKAGDVRSLLAFNRQGEPVQLG